MTDTADDARASGILARARSVLVIDWPSRDVPAALAAAGFDVTVKGGPGPTDYTVWEVTGGEPVTRQLGHAPEHADVVYCHRPFGELPSIIAMAQQLGATAIWRQSGLTSAGGKAPDGCWVPPGESREGRELAAAAGLNYIDDIYIAAAARALGGTGPA
jgi:predicted CoA-binding protein